MVVDQLTTEILLVSQCRGPERGALDVVGALNHPPIIETLNYNPSKFITCGEYGQRPSVELCAKAIDPDSDPLEFVWTQVGGDPVYSGPKVITHVREDGWEKQCVKIKLPYGSAGYEFELSVYDMFHGDEVTPTSSSPTNSLIRAETWFALNGYGDVDSHAKLRFPLYVSCEDPCADDMPNGDYQCEEYCYDREENQTECREDRCYDENRYEIDCEVPELTCPHSQGYWKNHNKYAKNPSQKIPWPISEDTQLCGKSWLNILKTPVGGNAFYILGYQYIAARLNIANGGPTSADLLAKIAEADALLNQCPNNNNHWNSNKAKKLASYLENYNLNKLLDCGNKDDWCKYN